MPSLHTGEWSCLYGIYKQVAGRQARAGLPFSDCSLYATGCLKPNHALVHCGSVPLATAKVDVQGRAIWEQATAALLHVINNIRKGRMEVNADWPGVTQYQQGIMAAFNQYTFSTMIQ